jgi:pyruvate dehydrogenase E2 component (dihydrolipoamide acetyltransferase)
MATYFRMPGVSADSDEAVLESWTVEQGATVSSGQPIASVETEKAVVEVEADVDAIVHTLLVDNGATVPVGDPIAILLGVDEPPSAAEKLLSDLGRGGGGEAGGATAPEAASDAVPDVEVTGDEKALEEAVRSVPEEAGPPSTPPPTAPASGARIDVGAGAAGNGSAGSGGASGGRQFSSPSARRVAREMGVDISSLTGSGPKGRVVRDDVLRAAEAGPATPAEAAAPAAEPVAAAAPAQAAPVAAQAAAAEAGSTEAESTEAEPAEVAPAQTAGPDTVPEGWTAVPHNRIRKIIAARLQESKQTAPHFYLRRSARVDALLALRAQLNASGRARISVNDLIVRAAALALQDVPEMNVIWTEDAVLTPPTVDVAVAVASEKGLMTPVLRDVPSLSLSALSARIKDAVARANAGKLGRDDLEGGTLTISNLGMYGIEEFDAILNPPQAGILAVGAAVRKPIVGEGDRIEVASVLSLVLSVDHRPVDGTIGARWLARLTELLEDPMQIVV